MSSLVLSRAGRLNLRAAEDLFPSLTHLLSLTPPPPRRPGLTLQCLPGRNALLFDIYPAMHIHGAGNAVARVPLTLLRPRPARHFGTNRAFVLRFTASISL